MPRVNTAEGFLWRAAPQPHRARLLGAIAIALSCGALGVLIGRWSVERVPSEPGPRTAALIEAVAKETRAKLAGAAEEPASKPPPQGGPLSVAPVASTPADGSSPAEPTSNTVASPAAPTSNTVASPEAREAPTPAPAAESASASPPVPHAAPPLGIRQAEQAERQRPPAVPPVVPEVRRPQPRAAPQATTAPDYRALRDYVLSR
jgi:hypothetical protein